MDLNFNSPLRVENPSEHFVILSIGECADLFLFRFTLFRRFLLLSLSLCFFFFNYVTYNVVMFYICDDPNCESIFNMMF